MDNDLRVSLKYMDIPESVFTPLVLSQVSAQVLTLKF